MPVRGSNGVTNTNPITNQPLHHEHPTTGVQPSTTASDLGHRFETSTGTDRLLGEVALSPEIRGRVDAVMDRYTARMMDILNHDAMSLARGERPVRNGSDLTSGQQDAIKDALQDLVMEMPIGALSSTIANKAKSLLDRHGADTANLETKTLKEVGNIGADVAKDLAKDWADSLKENSPGVYYGVGAAAAVALGAYGYAKGSDALENLGIKPEFKTDFFNDRVKVKAKASWDEGFKNPNLTLDASGNVTYRNFDLRLRGATDLRNLDSSTLRGDLRHGDSDNHLRGHATYAADGTHNFGLGGRATIGDTVVDGQANFDNNFSFTDGRVGISTRLGDHTTLNTTTTFDRDGLDTFRGSARYNRGNWTASGTVDHNFGTGRTSAEASARYSATDNLDFGVVGRYDSEGETHVGVGLRLNF